MTQSYPNCYADTGAVTCYALKHKRCNYGSCSFYQPETDKMNRKKIEQDIEKYMSIKSVKKG